MDQGMVWKHFKAIKLGKFQTLGNTDDKQIKNLGKK